ncbi:allantoinase [Tanacetum coccineum]
MLVSFRNNNKTGFWGGLVPENAFNASILESLLDAGALGLKSFMCPLGINDFPMTDASHIREGLSVLAKYKRPLLVHVEKQQEIELDDGVDDPRSYSTEETAIRELLTVAKDTRIGGRRKELIFTLFILRIQDLL